jgi:predicted Zn finger-like uncharacterized protein
MKFLCENCKAKYQIADEKVAGRTVRMKCRKCGHMIEVEASVTETSVAGARMPQDPKGGASSGVSGSQGAVRAAAAGLPPPRPPAAPPLRHSPPPAGAPVRPSSLPPPPGAQRGLSPRGAPRPAPNAGLAGAFSKAVTVPNEDPSSVSAAMAVLSSSSSTEEWYVGINGVPVGPVRLSELRRKAAGGGITEESLVWREGFEEWLPLRTFPELVALLREAGTGRASLTPAPGPVGTMQSSRPLAPQGPARMGAPLGAPGPRPAPAPRAGIATAARSNVVALASRRATAEKIDGLGEPEPLLDDIKFHTETPSPAEVDPEPAVVPAPTPAPVAAAEGFFPTGTVASPGPGEASHHSKLGARIAESRRLHPAAWLVVGLGGMFVGVAAMVFLLPKANSKPAVQIVSVMIPTPAPPAATTEGDGLTSIGPIEVSAPVVAKTTTGGGSKPAKAADPGGGAAPAAPLSTGLTGLTGLVGGPTAPSGGSSKSGGGGQLAAVDVERVVQQHRAFVKRQCWESALATRPPNAPSSARVAVSMSVASDGRVQNVTATGGDGYPGLSSCVQNQVKTWTFPPSDGSNVTVPFVFAAQ